MNEQEIKKLHDVQLSAMRALLGHITGNIDVVTVNTKNQKIDIYFIFRAGSEIAKEDYDNAESVKQKMQEDFPSDEMILHCFRIDSPEFPVKEGSAVFIRKFF